MSEQEDIQIVVFSLDNEEYGVNISYIREIIRLVDITRIPKLPDFIEGVINLRGQITTVIDLRKRFEMDPTISDATRVIIMDLNGEPIGIIVDSVSEVMEVSRDQIDRVPSIKDTSTREYLKGVCKIDDRIIILLDIGKILTELELVQTKNIKDEIELTNTQETIT